MFIADHRFESRGTDSATPPRSGAAHRGTPGAPEAQEPVVPDAHVSPWRLIMGLFGTPAAWSVQVFVCQTLSAHACYPLDQPLPAPTWPSLFTTLGIIVALTLLVGVAGLVVAWLNWRVARVGPVDRSPRPPLAVGATRTRFLSLAGLVLSSGFMAALIFTSSAYVLISSCGAGK